jgi:hypothetical protein
VAICYCSAVKFLQLEILTWHRSYVCLVCVTVIRWFSQYLYTYRERFSQHGNDNDVSECFPFQLKSIYCCVMSFQLSWNIF